MSIVRFDPSMNWNFVATLVIVGAGLLVSGSKMQAQAEYTREVLVELRAENAATRQEMREAKVEMSRLLVEARAELAQEQRSQDARVRILESGFGRIEERLIAITNILQQGRQPN